MTRYDQRLNGRDRGAQRPP